MFASGIFYDATVVVTDEWREIYYLNPAASLLQIYRDVLMQRAADVLNPDIAGAGGILAMLDIGALAEAHGAKMSPHCWCSSTVAFCAMLHVSAVMRNATYAELFYDYLELGAEFATCDYDLRQGVTRPPQRPGLGVEIDESKLQTLTV